MASTRDYATNKDGVKLRYEIRGNGDPLALIMGFSGSGRGWGEPFLSGIEKRYRTVVIDNRGTGESDKPDRPWTMTDMADDIATGVGHVEECNGAASSVVSCVGGGGGGGCAC